jgi:hypothetical protein
MKMNGSERAMRLVGIGLFGFGILTRFAFNWPVGAGQGLCILALMFGSLAYYSYSRRLKFRTWELEAQIDSLRQRLYLRSRRRRN